MKNMKMPIQCICLITFFHNIRPLDQEFKWVLCSVQIELHKETLTI